MIRVKPYADYLRPSIKVFKIFTNDAFIGFTSVDPEEIFPEWWAEFVENVKSGGPFTTRTEAIKFLLSLAAP